MKNETERTKYPFKLIAAGVAAGFVNGLLGTGGGIVTVFALGAMKIFSDPRDTFATSLAVTLCASAFSLLSYPGQTDVNLLKYALPAAIGGAFGAYISAKLKPAAVTFVFAAVTFISGINIIIS